MSTPRALRTAGLALARLVDRIVSALAAGGMRLLRRFDRRKMGNVTSAALQRIAPMLKEHKIARANLTAAFPEKAPEEIDAILMASWDNLGRFVAEFAHLDRLTLRDADAAAQVTPDIDYSDEVIARFRALRDTQKPILLFAAHLANWELPALAPARFGQPSAMLYRRPSVGGAADAALRIRGATMGDLIASGFDAPVKIAQALRDGKWVGMLVDQYKHNGVPVTFFGRRTRANPTIARLARHVEAPIHGARARRHADGRYTIEITPEIKPARDADGQIDVAATMQKIMEVIEGWIRETPEQWLWQHRRWRESDINL